MLLLYDLSSAITIVVHLSRSSGLSAHSASFNSSLYRCMNNSDLGEILRCAKKLRAYIRPFCSLSIVYRHGLFSGSGHSGNGLAFDSYESGSKLIVFPLVRVLDTWRAAKDFVGDVMALQIGCD